MHYCRDVGLPGAYLASSRADPTENFSFSLFTVGTSSFVNCLPDLSPHDQDGIAKYPWQDDGAPVSRPRTSVDCKRRARRCIGQTRARNHTHMLCCIISTHSSVTRHRGRWRNEIYPSVTVTSGWGIGRNGVVIQGVTSWYISFKFKFPQNLIFCSHRKTF